jgi:hypothetical protein
VKLYPWYADPPTAFDLEREPGAALSAGRIAKVPDNYRVNVLTFPDTEKMMKASTEIGQAELACIVAPAYLGGATAFDAEGADEMAIMQNEHPPIDPDLVARTVPVFVNGHSKRELKYREKAVLATMEKWGGHLEPDLNDPKIKCQIFMYQIWSSRALTAPRRCTLTIVRLSSTPLSLSASAGLSYSPIWVCRTVRWNIIR